MLIVRVSCIITMINALASMGGKSKKSKSRCEFFRPRRRQFHKKKAWIKFPAEYDRNAGLQTV